MSHRTNGRNLAVLLLLDLSRVAGDKVKVGNGEQTVLELSQEAVSLLAWSIEQLGDPFAIAGFHSDTRHDVRYLHLKGFSERWGDVVKAAWPRCRPATRRAWAPPCATPRITWRRSQPRRS
jgi:nitric oxide reductase NorD protein